MSSGHLLTIDPDDCRRLVAGDTVGRVSWVSAHRGLQVLPVNYVLDEDRIVFRTDPSSTLAELTEPVEVVFQVDDIDRLTATGWSVVARGRTAAASSSDTIAEPRPWAPGRRDLTIVIVVESLTGRVVSAAEA